MMMKIVDNDNNTTSIQVTLPCGVVFKDLINEKIKTHSDPKIDTLFDDIKSNHASCDMCSKIKAKK